MKNKPVRKTISARYGTIDWVNIFFHSEEIRYLSASFVKNIIAGDE
jgi:hypothetical protein